MTVAEMQLIKMTLIEQLHKQLIKQMHKSKTIYSQSNMKHLNQMKWFSSQYLNVLSTFCSWQAQTWSCGATPSTAVTKYIFVTTTLTVFRKCEFPP